MYLLTFCNKFRNTLTDQTEPPSCYSQYCLLFIWITYHRLYRWGKSSLIQYVNWSFLLLNSYKSLLQGWLDCKAQAESGIRHQDPLDNFAEIFTSSVPTTDANVWINRGRVWINIFRKQVFKADIFAWMRVCIWAILSSCRPQMFSFVDIYWMNGKSVHKNPNTLT